MKFQAVTSCCYLGPRQAEMPQTLRARSPGSALNTVICCFAPRSVFLAVNRPLTLYTLIILFTSSKCASSARSFVFLSACPAFTHAPLITCPLRDVVVARRQIYSDVSRCTITRLMWSHDQSYSLTWSSMRCVQPYNGTFSIAVHEPRGRRWRTACWLVCEPEGFLLHKRQKV